MKIKTVTLCVLALFASSAPAVLAGPEPTHGLKSVEFLSGWRKPGGHHMAAVRFNLAEGWKTYWRAPGGIGIPATFDWTGSDNLSEVRFHWPAPNVYDDNGLISIGYKEELVLPIELTAERSGDPITVSAVVELGVCADICVPVSATIEAELMPDAAVTEPAITDALAAGAIPAEHAGITSVSCTLAPMQDGFAVTARFFTPDELSEQALTVLEYPKEDIWIDGVKMTRTGGDVMLSANIFDYSELPLMIDRSKLRLTLLDQGRAVDIQGCPSP